MRLRRRGVGRAGVGNHCRRALAAGLPKDHLLQAMEITAAVLATRTLASGVNAVMAAEAK